MSPRTSHQLQELRENKKQQILQAALKVFAGKGYNGATINMIAKEAGISKGLMYSYYESKEKLLEELLNFGMQKAASFLYEDTTRKLDSKEAFAASLRKMIQLFLQEARLLAPVYHACLATSYCREISERSDGVSTTIS